jgi:hypothetical protein
MISQAYRNNRPRFPQSELVKFRGSWVAFSADGCGVVASAATVQQLEEQLASLGIDGGSVVLEWIVGPEDDSLLGGGEML